MSLPLQRRRQWFCGKGTAAGIFERTGCEAVPRNYPRILESAQSSSDAGADSKILTENLKIMENLGQTEKNFEENQKKLVCLERNAFKIQKRNWNLAIS